LETAIWQSYPQDSVIVVGITAVNQNQINQFVDETGLTYPILQDQSTGGNQGGFGGEVYDDYYIPNQGSPYPRDFIIDQNGILVYANNEVDTEYMLYILDELLFGEYFVNVEDGFGSGYYSPGDTVHIWGDLSPETMVFEQWAGDTTFLENSKEWHDIFVMPNYDLEYQAVQENVGEIEFVYESIQGVEYPKNVYYYFPEDPEGVIFLFHGGNGNAEGIKNRVEVNQFLQDAKVDNFGFIVTESEDRTLNDANDDGATPWLLYPWSIEENIDIGNVQAIIDTFLFRGSFSIEAPIFSVGVSNGGNFSSVVAHALGLNAAAMYSAQGNPPELYQVTTTPTLFCPAKYDPAIGGGNWGAVMNYDSLQARGIPSLFFELDRSPVYPERFARIPNIDDDLSVDIFNEFQSLGFIDDNNYFTVLDDSITSLYLNNSEGFPILEQLEIETIRHVMDQIKVMTADHSFYSNHNKRTLAFFRNHMDQLSIDSNKNFPDDFALYPAYPNPFNPTTMIRFNISVGDANLRPLQLTLYDITGRLVETLINQQLEPGVHEIQWDAKNLPSGLYFIQLQSGTKIQTQKLILLK
jgi:hypothetical protein